MPNTAELVKLPVAQRLALIDELLASLPDAEVVAELSQVEEARSRLRELQASPALGLSYDELKARLG
jgi:putative addiction module component (TIGR02574 family)